MGMITTIIIQGILLITVWRKRALIVRSFHLFLEELKGVKEFFNMQNVYTVMGWYREKMNLVQSLMLIIAFWIIMNIGIHSVFPYISYVNDLTESMKKVVLFVMNIYGFSPILLLEYELALCMGIILILKKCHVSLSKVVEFTFTSFLVLVAAHVRILYVLFIRVKAAF